MIAVVSGLDKVCPLPKTKKPITRSQMLYLGCPVLTNFGHGTKCDVLYCGCLVELLSYTIKYLRFVERLC